MNSRANETSPYPLHKGDFLFVIQILRFAQDDNSFPLWKGARGMLTPNGFISIVYE